MRLGKSSVAAMGGLALLAALPLGAHAHDDRHDFDFRYFIVLDKNDGACRITRSRSKGDIIGRYSSFRTALRWMEIKSECRGQNFLG